MAMSLSIIVQTASRPVGRSGVLPKGILCSPVPNCKTMSIRALGFSLPGASCAVSAPRSGVVTAPLTHVFCRSTCSRVSERWKDRACAMTASRSLWLLTSVQPTFPARSARTATRVSPALELSSQCIRDVSPPSRPFTLRQAFHCVRARGDYCPRFRGERPAARRSRNLQ